MGRPSRRTFEEAFRETPPRHTGLDALRRAALLAAATLAAAGTGGLNPSLEVPITGTWQCLADRGGDLRRLRGRNPAFRG
jgi:hypothetical protein